MIWFFLLNFGTLRNANDAVICTQKANEEIIATNRKIVEISTSFSGILIANFCLINCGEKDFRLIA